MKRASIIVTAILVVLQLSSSLWALPTTAYDAEMVVTGWLKADPKPLGSDLGRQIMSVETFADDHGEAIYHVVYLQPSGFVIVSTDDLVEPIIAFSGNGTYDPSPGNPLEALVTKDLKGRILAVRSTFVPLAIAPQAADSETQKKWNSLIGLAEVSNGGFEPLAIAPICDDNLSDLRVPPLVHSKWGQSNYYDGDNQPRACYNYCTPQLIGNRVSFVEGQEDNYPCGCVAITVAQFMRCQEYPEEPVEPAQFTILVEESKADRWLLRGDGPGGAYNWDDMVAVPGDETTEQQRRAIGVLCHDAAIAVDTQFGAEGSGASLDNVVNAFLETFQYKNAVWAEREGGLLDRRNFISLINPNLDAGIPVIIGFRVSAYKWIGHAALCDGYGYNLSILYHHLNMGWEGQEDCWYALPDIACPDMVAFDVITQCAYNIFTDCTGEIISGRIIDPDGRPMEDIKVTAQGETNTDVHTAVTNGKGIYAFKGLDSETAYTIAPDRMGYDFDMNLGYDYTLNIVRTGRSGGESFISGNRWGVDFVGYRNSVTITIGQEISAWDYPMHTEHHDSRAQVIYLAGEIGRSGTITAMSLDVADIPNGPMTDWTIRIKHTGLSEYTSASLDAAGWTEVYRTSESDVGQGWHKFEFQTPFEYNGTDNLMVDFSHNNLSGSQNGQCRASSPGPMRTVFAQSNSEYKNPLDWSGTASPATYLDDHVPNLRVMFSAGESQVFCADTKLTASDGERNGHFGCSVSISGDYAIVGADGDDSNRGAAYIFKREGTSWTEQAKLRAPVPRQFDDGFGREVSISGKHAIVTSTNRFLPPYIFVREGANWIRQSDLGGGYQFPRHVWVFSFDKWRFCNRGIASG